MAGFCTRGKTIPKHYKLNVKFYVASVETDTEVKALLAAQVAVAEQMFNTKPALKINWTWERKNRAGGKSLKVGVES